ncbi:hypothetical protein MBANPS3_012623, partial [Mucor bainieri]
LREQPLFSKVPIFVLSLMKASSRTHNRVFLPSGFSMSTTWVKNKNLTSEQSLTAVSTAVASTPFLLKAAVK